MHRPNRVRSLAVAALLALLAGCGLEREEAGEGGVIRNPMVAATVNGRPIFVEDVRAHAVGRGWLDEAEDLDANSDEFYLALEELIEVRLFALEAETRGLDREAGVRRQLENARERVLANAIYEELDERAVDPEAVERLYRENVNRLGQGEEVNLRHIQFESREAADAAKRRLDQGERFEALAFELTTDRESAPDGGSLGFAALSDIAPTVRREAERATVGQVFGPLQLPSGWHLFRLEDRRSAGAPSLETLRPQIINWLRYREISQLNERLAGDARIERLREPEAGDEEGESPASADTGSGAAAPPRPAPRRPSGEAPPPFPFPGGPAQDQGAASSGEAQ
jgi:peptidyl-prolyl cis-trans isomerase C